MRRIRTSRTFDVQLTELLEFGEARFGARVATEKRRLLYHAIEQFLAVYPHAKQPDPLHGLVAYPISHTPFVVLYDFDDAVLRVHFVFHKLADLADLDPDGAEW